MSAISCNYFHDLAESWLEGQRTAEATAHVSSCADCSALVKDLEAIRAEAPRLASLDGDAPERVWLALRAEIEREGLIHPTRDPHSRGWSAWIEEIFESVPRPAIAGAYVVALVALSLTFVGPLQNHFHQRTIGSAVAPLNAQLDSTEQDAISSLSDLNPAVTASLQSNLELLDKDISLCEKTLQENPNDETSRDYLYEAYQEKADLLAEISERGAFGQ